MGLTGYSLEDDLENSLEAYLSPVPPRQEFVTRLKTRLTTEPAIVVENRSRATAFVVASLGLFVGALLVWILIGLRSYRRGASTR